MSADTEEILHAIAAGQIEIHQRFKELDQRMRDGIRDINERLDRVLVLTHAIELDIKPIEIAIDDK